jgi:hypothetical protein
MIGIDDSDTSLTDQTDTNAFHDVLARDQSFNGLLQSAISGGTPIPAVNLGTIDSGFMGEFLGSLFPALGA